MTAGDVCWVLVAAFFGLSIGFGLGARMQDRYWAAHAGGTDVCHDGTFYHVETAADFGEFVRKEWVLRGVWRPTTADRERWPQCAEGES